jgi:hypothetical protein
MKVYVVKMWNNFFLILPLLAGIWHFVVRVELDKDVVL